MPPEESGYAVSPKKKWTMDELEEVKRLFADNIKEEMITMEMVKIMESDFLLLQGVPLRKIYWKIRSLHSNKENEELQLKGLPVETQEEKISRVIESLHYEDKGEEDDDDFIPPSVSSASFGKEKVFSTANSALIKKLCKHQIEFGGIGKEAITKVLESCMEGRELLRVFTLSSIINRVKYERRLKIRK